MIRGFLRSVPAIVLLACAADTATSVDLPPVAPRAPVVDEGVPVASPTSSPGPGTASPAAAPAPLRVRFLGVDGFMLESGGDRVLTAPLFTRPTMVQASTGLPVSSDVALVERSLPTADLTNLRAVISGHAHYDHLLDAPAVLQRAPGATLYTNRSGKNLLAAYAPDRAAQCAGKPAATPSIARSRVVAVDDGASSVVDWTACPDRRPPGAPLAGRWVSVPGSHVRVLAVCSEHPDQIGPFHYGAGDVEEEACTPPTRMDAWKEGETVAFLVDFLDPATGAPKYRIYYQDAPTNAPVGLVPAGFLAEKRVDLALLCVGSSDHVKDGPASAIAALSPRFAIGGHWEDFFRGAAEPVTPILFLDVPGWQATARKGMPASATSTPWVRNGAGVAERAIVPQPGDRFEVPASE